MKSRGIVWPLVFFLGALSLHVPAWGAEKKPVPQGKTIPGASGLSAQPLRITSQQLEADNKNQVIIFTGNIVARQGDLVIHADAARVYYEKREEGNEVREIEATGNVKIHQGDRVATGQRAQFLNQEQKIILTGQPRVWQGKDMVSGDKITVLLEEDRSLVESGPDRRVEVILYPKGEASRTKGKP
ncbi:MAG: lipopolysaccharide transport periplasmic protein LptA [Syntrophaceae bacterium]|jgi:lipopolysaccharide export system protein LptA|nr:lipopolysaccharide transport periplasmic protein LptA [Syntrophaceae bacterium]